MKSSCTRVLMLLIVAPLALVPAAVAQEGEDVVERALEVCRPEIETYCSQVTPGEGRLLACFIAHEDKISGQCGWAVYEAMSELEALVDAIAYVADSCWDDMVEHCAEVEMGEGRVAECLLLHKEEVSSQCSQAMDDVELELVDD